MDKKKIISLLESKKPIDIKISNSLSKKDLIKSLLEQQLPSMADLQTQANKGEFVSLPTIEDKKKPKTTIKGFAIQSPQVQGEPQNQPEERKIEEKKPDGKITIKNDLGFKSVVFDKNFINIDTKDLSGEYAKISGMFKPEEIEAIKKDPDIKNWKKVDPYPLYVREHQISTGTKSKMVTARNAETKENRKFNSYGILVRSIYTRLDEDGKVKPIEVEVEIKTKKSDIPRYTKQSVPGNKKSYILKKQETPKKTRKVKFIPVTKRSGVQAGMYKVKDNKYAIALQFPEDKDIHLFPMTVKAASFFFKPLV